MKVKKYFATAMILLVCTFIFFVFTASAEKKIPETVILKIEGAKMSPATFSHSTHNKKAKIDCAICHHKDKDPKEAQTCTTCHQLTEVKDNALIAKEAFHKQCITCHKENTAKDIKAPTKCSECHKK